jgi:MFS superfamily sulfate permease-like transporter
MLDVATRPPVSTPAAPPGPDAVPFFQRLRYYLNPIDARYEDLRKGKPALNVLRDFTAGLIVAMVAIPLAMGFAMASGLRPEQGIIGGAIAGVVGALWGGSKYQVYGPTAAFIPVIGGVMAKYDHRVLVLAALISGAILLALGLARWGRIVTKVPHSIVVGFTIGIAVTIALSQIGEILGIKARMPTHFLEKVETIAAHASEINIYAVMLGLVTFVLTKYLLKVSVFIPAPLIALAATSAIAATAWSGKGLSLIRDKYGKIPTDFFTFTPPAAISWTPEFLADLAYFVVAIVLVSAIESLLCSRMADRLADNRGVPFNPNKELWGQGLVQIFIPLMNGFPHTGALARTATNIKLGAVSPLAGIFKATLKLLLALFLAQYLEAVPMACIGGILLYVATAMVKPTEVRQVLAHNGFHIFLMLYTAVVVVLTDFLIGVVTAIVIWAALYRWVDKPVPAPQQATAQV